MYDMFINTPQEQTSQKTRFEERLEYSTVINSLRCLSLFASFSHPVFFLVGGVGVLLHKQMDEKDKQDPVLFTYLFANLLQMDPPILFRSTATKWHICQDIHTYAVHLGSSVKNVDSQYLPDHEPLKT